MKRIIGFLYFTIVSNFAFGQDRPIFIKLIDAQVSNIEANSKHASKLFVDSTKSLDPFTEAFFTNSKTGGLAKVEFAHINPDMKVTYYYLNDTLIKISAIDKSTETILNIHTYLQGNNIIFTTHRSIDGDNGRRHLLNQAKNYLSRFNKER